MYNKIYNEIKSGKKIYQLFDNLLSDENFNTTKIYCEKFLSDITTPIRPTRDTIWHIDDTKQGMFVQQMVKQILLPILDAHLQTGVYSGRPLRSYENFIATLYRLAQLSKLPYVLKVAIKSEDIPVKYTKKQLWNIGIRDRKILSLCNQLYNYRDSVILESIFENINLSQLDTWISSQWEANPVTDKYSTYQARSGSICKGNGYRAMQDSTNLKEIHMVRYGSVYYIFFRKLDDMVKFKYAISEWIEKRLRVPFDIESRNLYNQYLHVDNIKMRLVQKRDKYVVQSKLTDGIKKEYYQVFKRLIINLQHGKNTYKTTSIYNNMVMRLHSEYSFVTDISLDCSDIAHHLKTVLYTRLKGRLKKNGKHKVDRYYIKSKQLRFIDGYPLYPVSYVKTIKPKGFSNSKSYYE